MPSWHRYFGLTKCSVSSIFFYTYYYSFILVTKQLLKDHKTIKFLLNPNITQESIECYPMLLQTLFSFSHASRTYYWFFSISLHSACCVLVHIYEVCFHFQHFSSGSEGQSGIYSVACIHVICSCFSFWVCTNRIYYTQVLTFST